MGGQNISKFSTASPPGLVTATTHTNKGDLVVSNKLTNPTSDRYGWHIVTTEGPVNNAALRLDGASSQPTFASIFHTVRLGRQIRQARPIMVLRRVAFFGYGR